MDLVKLIIENITDDLTDIEKARYIYIEIARLLKFSTNLKSNTEENFYNQLYNKKYDIRNLMNSEITCNNWADIYIELLKYVDIKAIKRINLYNHAWVEIEIDNTKIYADATEGVCTDLARVKQNRKTINFKFLNSGDYSDEMFFKRLEFEKKLDEIDEKLGYKLKREKSYEFLEKIKKESALAKDIFDKFDYIISSVDFRNYGFFEGNEYIRYILNICLSSEELDKFKFVKMSRTLLNGTIESAKCIILSSSLEVKYYIYNEQNGIINISKDDFVKLSNIGYGIENNETISGVSSIKNFKVYDYSTSDKIRLQRENLYLKKYLSEKIFRLKCKVY